MRPTASEAKISRFVACLAEVLGVVVRDERLDLEAAIPFILILIVSGSS
jgi:uncharacterized membrane protein